jgi:hypothetical protein
VVFWQPMIRTKIASTILASERQKSIFSTFLALHAGTPLMIKMQLANRLYVSL